MKDSKFKIFFHISSEEKQEYLGEISDEQFSEGRIALSTFMTPAYFDNIVMNPLLDMDSQVEGFESNLSGDFYDFEELGGIPNKALLALKSLPYYGCLKYTKPEDRQKHCKNMFDGLEDDQKFCNVF